MILLLLIWACSEPESVDTGDTAVVELGGRGAREQCMGLPPLEEEWLTK